MRTRFCPCAKMMSSWLACALVSVGDLNNMTSSRQSFEGLQKEWWWWWSKREWNCGTRGLGPRGTRVVGKHWRIGHVTVANDVAPILAHGLLGGA